MITHAIVDGIKFDDIEHFSSFDSNHILQLKLNDTTQQSIFYNWTNQLYNFYDPHKRDIDWKNFPKREISIFDSDGYDMILYGCVLGNMCGRRASITYDNLEYNFKEIKFIDISEFHEIY